MTATRFVLVFALMLATLPIMCRSEVTGQTLEHATSVHLLVRITNIIASEDLAQLSRVFANATTEAKRQRKPISPVWFVLDTPGGDVRAAMQIGRWARKNDVTALVKGECSSACVLILAGATSRQLLEDGRVGIHRTFFPTLDTSASYEQVRAQMRNADLEIAVYLQEMDVPVSLLEEMKSVPPNGIRYLTSAELDRLRLQGTDPVAQERVDARMAKRYGVSREEYYRRYDRARRLCTRPEVDGKCIEAVLSGTR